MIDIENFGECLYNRHRVYLIRTEGLPVKRAKITKPVDKSIATRGFARFMFYFVQLTWGLPVNIVGGILFLFFKLFRKSRHERFCNAVISYIPWKQGGLSMGLFIFMADGREEKWTRNTRIHEYGHTIQCMLLGVFYFFVVGIPSAVWCNFFEGYRRKNNVSYYKLYCESWANSWGQKWSGMKQYGIK